MLRHRGSGLVLRLLEKLTTKLRKSAKNQKLVLKIMLELQTIK